MVTAAIRSKQICSMRRLNYITIPVSFDSFWQANADGHQGCFKNNCLGLFFYHLEINSVMGIADLLLGDHARFRWISIKKNKVLDLINLA